jgi:hypothetical protein
LENENKVPILASEENPYVEAFWKWWPELYRDLHTFRITGGEPLMSKDTWGVLDYIINEPNPNKELNLAINTNLGVPDKLIDKFIDKIKRIEDGDKVKEFVVFTSVDTWGEQAEYIRNGLVFNKFCNVSMSGYFTPTFIGVTGAVDAGVVDPDVVPDDDVDPVDVPVDVLGNRDCPPTIF